MLKKFMLASLSLIITASLLFGCQAEPESSLILSIKVVEGSLLENVEYVPFTTEAYINDNAVPTKQFVFKIIPMR